MSNIRALDAAIQSLRKTVKAKEARPAEAFGQLLARSRLAEAQTDAEPGEQAAVGEDGQAAPGPELALVLPSRATLGELAVRLAGGLAGAFARAGLPRSPAVTLTVDGHGAVHAAGHPEGGRIAALFASEPELDRLLHDVNALASHAARMEGAGSGGPLARIAFTFDAAGMALSADGQPWMDVPA